MGYDNPTPQAPEMPEEIRNQTRGKDEKLSFKNYFYNVFFAVVGFTTTVLIFATIQSDGLSYIPKYYKSLFSSPVVAKAPPQKPIDDSQKIADLEKGKGEVHPIIKVRYSDNLGVVFTVVSGEEKSEEFWTNAEKCLVRINGKMDYTALWQSTDSATVAWAKKIVIIYVPNKEDFEKWHQWLEKKKKEEAEENKKRIEHYKPRRVLPPD